MRHGDEAVQVLEAVYAILSASQPLADALGVPLADLPDRVWPDVAPDATAAPFVVFAIQPDSTDHLALGDQPRIFTTAMVDAKVIGQTRDYGSLAPAARALYEALHGRTNVEVADGGVVLTMRRTGGIQYPEQAGGIEYRHLGHTLQAEVQ